jgi:hypothetical protein
MMCRQLLLAMAPVVLAGCDLLVPDFVAKTEARSGDRDARAAAASDVGTSVTFALFPATPAVRARCLDQTRPRRRPGAPGSTRGGKRRQLRFHVHFALSILPRDLPSCVSLVTCMLGSDNPVLAGRPSARSSGAARPRRMELPSTVTLTAGGAAKRKIFETGSQSGIR